MSATAAILTPSKSSPPRRAKPAASTSGTYAERAEQYAKDVCAKKIVACVEVRQACKRHIDYLKRSRKPGYRWTFDPVKANRFCRFVEALPHIKDDFRGNASRGELIHLEPWQIFIGCSIFGWVDKERGFRRFTEAFIEVARKNGKTTLAAGVALYCLTADREFGAEVFAGASSKDQAGEVFRAAKAMAEKAADFRQAFGVWVNTASLVVQQKGASFRMLKGRPADGPSPSCVTADEYHEYKTDDLLDWARTGMQARRQPLLLEITTAGSNTGSPCYNKHLEAQEVLAGRRINDRLFTIIFTVDKGVDWKSKKAVMTANPNYGVSVNPELIEADQFQATQSATRQNGFKTKNLNIWVNQRVAWMNMAKWDLCADPEMKIEDFLGEQCVVAVDLASRRDTVSTVRLFKRVINGEEHYYCFSRHYLNQLQIEDPKHTHFREWAAQGYLIQTPGNVTDYLLVNDDLAADAQLLSVRELVFDPLHAAPLVQFLQAREDWNQGIEISEIKQSEENTSPAMKEWEALVLSGRFHFDGNPLLTWMVGNTRCRVSGKEHWFPERENVERKIDGSVAIILGIKRLMAPEESGFSPFVM
jgi:phage terminase large subunit-like protein